jgi:hypothetical protein
MLREHISGNFTARGGQIPIAPTPIKIAKAKYQHKTLINDNSKE